MRPAVAWLTLALAAGAGLDARAQTPPTTVTCSGGMIAGPIGLSISDPLGATPQSVAATYVPFVFDKAECDCSTSNVNLEIQVTMALPLGTIAKPEVWVGTGCDNYATRTQSNQTACEQILNTGLSSTSFNVGSGNTNNLIEIPIPARSLISPQKHDCSAAATAYSDIYVFIITTDPMTPAGSCHLQLTEQLAGPSVAVTPSAQSGDGAITLSWSPPASSAAQPFQFQVLCSDACGNPLGQSKTLGYSVCLNGVMHRRPLPTASSTGVTTSDDGGVTTSTDMAGTMSVPLGTEAAPAGDGGVVASNCVGVPDGGTALDAGVPFNPFVTLDPAFLCSDPIPVAGTSYSVRVGNLTNGSPYFFSVLSIDQYGNATSSPPVTGIPAPTEDLYRRYWDANGRAHGFCFIATAAFGSYEDRYVKVLREFRDQVLMPSESGRAFVDWYYASSPPVAAYIAEHKSARIGTQLALWPVIGAAAAWLYTSAWQKALLGTLLLAWIFRRRIRRLMRRAA